MRIETQLRKIPTPYDSPHRGGPSYGQRLRAARQASGMTLKEVAELIGYSWVAVERWELDRCVPKPGVLWHLRQVYRVGDDWLPIAPSTAAFPRTG